MTRTVFFSSQADTPTLTGRNLIERALERALGRIAVDTGVVEAERELAVDRDTKGVPGTPPIIDTIFAKIDAATVFLPDLTFVGERGDGRPTPNPNVLIEYGWALKSLSHSRMVPVMNTAFGEPTAEAMPFDMRHLRNPIIFYCPDGASDDERKIAKEDLSKQLEAAIRVVIESESARSDPASEIDAGSIHVALGQAFLQTFDAYSAEDAKRKNIVGWRPDVTEPPRYAIRMSAVPRSRISVPGIVSSRFRLPLECVLLDGGKSMSFPGFPELAHFQPEVRAWRARSDISETHIEQLLRSDGVVDASLMQWFPVRNRSLLPIEWLFSLCFGVVFLVEKLKILLGKRNVSYEYQLQVMTRGNMEVGYFFGRPQPGVLRFPSNGETFPTFAIGRREEVGAPVRGVQQDVWSSLGRQMKEPIHEVFVNLPLMWEHIDKSAAHLLGQQE